MTTTLEPHPLKDAPAPGTPEWASIITASKVPPMVTLPNGEYAGHGYITAWEQYEEIKGRFNREITDYEQAMFDAAHEREEPAIEQWVSRQDNPEHWEIHLQEAWTNPLLPYENFATFDARAHNTETGENIGLEVKSPITGGMKTNWALQTVAQRIMSGLGRIDLIVYPFSSDTIEVHNADLNGVLVKKVADDIERFNDMLKADTPPPGGDIQIDDATLERLKELRAAEQAAAEAYKQAKNELIDYVQAQGGRRAVHADERVATLVNGRFSAARVPDEYADILKLEELQKTTVKLDETKLKKNYPWVYAAGIGDPYLTLSRNI